MGDEQRAAMDFMEQLLGPKVKPGASKAVSKSRELYDAIWEGDFEAAFNALEAGADPSEGFGTAKNTSVHVAARTNHPQILGMLLLRSPGLANVRNSDDETPLFGAVKEGNVRATQTLVDANADINAGDKSGRTVLSIARSKDLQDFVEFLEGNGAKDTPTDVEAAKAPPVEPEALRNVIETGLTGGEGPLGDEQQSAMDFMEQLLGPKAKAGADKAVSKSRELYDAIWEGDFEAAFTALEKGADPAEGFGTSKNTSVHVAARTNHPQILGMLLLRSPGLADLRNTDDETPLFGAVKEGNVQATQTLVDANADINARDKSGRTVLSIARSKELQDFVEFLQGNGATE